MAMAINNRRSLRAFTLAELAIVLAMVAIAMALGLSSLVDAVRVQQRNAALAQANLQLREQRALALETREPHFVKPSADGKSIQIGKATFTTGASDCTSLVTQQTIPINGLTVSGSPVCFTQDGNNAANAERDLNFNLPGGGANVASVKVFAAGTFRWSGFSLFKCSGFAITSISVRSFASANLTGIQ